RGMTAPARRACTRSPESSVTRCRTSTLAASATRTRSTWPDSSLRNRDPSIRSKIAIMRGERFRWTRCTINDLNDPIELRQREQLAETRARVRELHRRAPANGDGVGLHHGAKHEAVGVGDVDGVQQDVMRPLLEQPADALGERVRGRWRLLERLEDVDDNRLGGGGHVPWVYPRFS